MNCAKCNIKIQKKIVIEGRPRNLQNRKFCLECSPFGNHNTRSLIFKDLKCLVCDKPLTGNRTKFCSDECRPNKGGQSYICQKIRATSRKITFIKRLGGCCSLCGYKKNTAALAFHHRDPQQKSFMLDSRKMSNSTIAAIEKELDKCILVCHNCHQELHNPELNNLL